MRGYKEKDYSIKISEPEPGGMTNTVFAGSICLLLSCIFPPFTLGSIACGILAILQSERKAGVVILILTPVSTIIGFALSFAVYYLIIFKWVLPFYLKSVMP